MTLFAAVTLTVVVAHQNSEAYNRRKTAPMKTNRLKTVAVIAAVSLGSLVATGVAADSLEAVLKVGDTRTAQAQQSQQRIDRIADETGNLLQEYKKELKLLEDLKVYNRKLEIQIEHQQTQLADIERSVQDVTV